MAVGNALGCSTYNHSLSTFLYTYIHIYLCLYVLPTFVNVCELLHCLLPFRRGVKIALRNKLINKYARNSLEIGHVFALLIFAISLYDINKVHNFECAK